MNYAALEKKIRKMVHEKNKGMPFEYARPAVFVGYTYTRYSDLTVRREYQVSVVIQDYCVQAQTDDQKKMFEGIKEHYSAFIKRFA